MNTDSFIGLLREKDEKREEISRLRRQLIEAEKRLREIEDLIDSETRPRTVTV